MLNNDLADFYERDVRKLIEEINLFKNEEDIWRTAGSLNNPAGNLALHITGGLNHLIGATLAQTGYVRNREKEFAANGIARKEIVADLEALIPVIRETISALTPQQMEAKFPILFDKPGTSTGYVLIQLLLHLNYHLGQVNYLRRMLE